MGALVLGSHASTPLRRVVALAVGLARRPPPSRPKLLPAVHAFVAALCASLETKGTEHTVQLAAAFLASKPVVGLKGER